MIERIISVIEGDKGPLFVVTAAMHGNEQAGIAAVHALHELFLHTGKRHWLKGTFVGLMGNVQAVEHGVRYIESDLNRLWERDFVNEVLKGDISNQHNEIKEMHEIILSLRKIVMTGKYNKLYLLDLHTTSSDGIFAICTEDAESIRIAGQLHVPLVRGLLNGLSGTTLHYFNRNNLGIEATALAFEGGRHEDPDSAHRMVAAVINCMHTIGMLPGNVIENIHDELLKRYSEGLPQQVEVLYNYTIEDKQSWEMLPGFKNFDPVEKGQLLAHDRSGPVHATHTGLILMPLYQKKGRDGFFIVKPLR